MTKYCHDNKIDNNNNNNKKKNNNNDNKHDNNDNNNNNHHHHHHHHSMNKNTRLARGVLEGKRLPLLVWSSSNHVSTCVYTYIYIYIYIYIHIYVYVCMCVYVYIYIYIYIEREREMYTYIYIYILFCVYCVIWCSSSLNHLIQQSAKVTKSSSGNLVQMWLTARWPERKWEVLLGIRPAPRSHFWCGLSNRQADTAQMGT